MGLGTRKRSRGQRRQQEQEHGELDSAFLANGKFLRLDSAYDDTLRDTSLALSSTTVVAGLHRPKHAHPLDPEQASSRGLARLGFSNLFSFILTTDRDLRVDYRDAWAYFYGSGSLASPTMLKLALKDFDETLGMAPDCLSALLGRSLVCTAMGKTNQGRAILRRALQVMPTTGAEWWTRGLARLFARDAHGALTDFDEAINRGYRTAPAHLSRGYGRQQCGDLVGASADFDEAIYFDPAAVDAYHLRGLARHIEGNLEGTVEDYNEALAIDPANAAVLNSRAGLRLSRGDIDGARVDCEDAARLAPCNGTILLNRARLRVDAPADAIAECNRALQLGADTAWAYCIRGSLRILLRQPYNSQSAAEDFQRALRADSRVLEALQPHELINEASLSRPFLTLGAVNGRTLPAFEPMKTTQRLQRFIGMIHGTSWLILGAMIGILFALARIQIGSAMLVAESGIGVWMIFGAICAAFVGAMELPGLVRYLGGYGALRELARAATGCVTLGNSWLTTFMSQSSWWPSFRFRGGLWDSCGAGENHQVAYKGHLLKLACALTLLRALFKASLGVLVGIFAWSLLTGPPESMIPGALVGGLLGPMMVVAYISGNGRATFRELVVRALTGAASGVAIGAILSRTCPGLFAGALAGGFVAEIVRRNANRQLTTRACSSMVLAMVAGAFVGIVEAGAMYRVFSSVIAYALEGTLAGGVIGVLFGFLFGSREPRTVVMGALGERVFGDFFPNEKSLSRLPFGMLSATVGLLAGGNIGLLAGGMMGLLAGVIPALDERVWVLCGGALGACLTEICLRQSVGVKALLISDKKLELLLPSASPRRFLALVIGGGTGTLVSAWQWLPAETTLGVSYSVVATAFVGGLIALKIRSLSIASG